jgi:4-amino-4-deoxy-L-arabinose transferase-like glycosyltransferase
MQGQQPYRDFVLPYGPFAFWLQAAVFSIFGVTYRVYVLTAAVLNGLGAVLAYLIIRRMIPGRPWLAWAAGILTGAWFYAPMGTTDPQQTAFIFLFAAIAAIVMGLERDQSINQRCWMLFAGMALGLAILCKTNAAIFGVMLVFGTTGGLAFSLSWAILKNWVAIALGIIVVLAGFAVWLWTKSAPALFYSSFFQTAGAQGSARLFGHGYAHLLSILATGKGNDALRIITLACATLFLLALASVAVSGQANTTVARHTRRIAVLGLGLVCFQHLFGLSSSNNGTDEAAFIGLTLCLALELLFSGPAGGNNSNSGRGLNRIWILVLLVAAGGITGLIWPAGKDLDLVGGVVVGLGLAWMARWFEDKNLPQANWSFQVPPCIFAVSWVLLVALFGLGTWVSYDRKVQDYFDKHTTYVAHDTIPALAGLRWAAGVAPGSTHAEWADFEGLLREVQADPGQFFIVSDYEILYALAGKDSIGPIPWYHKGLTYPENYNPLLDQRMVQAVDRPEVTRIIVQDELFMDPHPLEDFPLLQAVIRDHYHPAEQFGVFKVYRRNS